MDRRALIVGGSAALVVPLAAEAQAGKVYHVGFILTGAANEVEHLTKALDDGLRELGYVEGRNVAFERRFGGGGRIT